MILYPLIGGTRGCSLSFITLTKCSSWRSNGSIVSRGKLLSEKGFHHEAESSEGYVFVFSVGKSKVVRQSDGDQVSVVAAGVTLFEALSAHEQLAAEGIAIRVIDLFSVQPIDKETLTAAARATNGLVVTVEDHYAHGGIGDAVLSALATEKASVHKLAVRGIARSGPSAELLDRFGISARHIVNKVKELVS